MSNPRNGPAELFSLLDLLKLLAYLVGFGVVVYWVWQALST